VAADARLRILEATYTCVARYGLAKTTVEDVVRRRTTLAVRGLATPEVRGRIAGVMGLQPSAVDSGS